MSSPAGMRQRPAKDKKRPTTPNPETMILAEKNPSTDSKEKARQLYRPASLGAELDYKAAMAVLTVLAFVTRFWGIKHPDQVVFDEVHFGKVRTFPRYLSYRGFPRMLAKPIVCRTTNMPASSPRTTCSELTSSTSTLRSESSSLPLLAGWLATRASFSLKTLATRTSPTKFLTWHTAPCLLHWVPSQCLSSS